MNRKTLIILLILLVILGAATALYLTQKPAGTEVAMGTPLYDGLDVNAVSSIQVVSRSHEFKVEKTPNGWMVDTGFPFPADFSKVSGFLTGLAGLTIGRAFPETPERIERLDLIPPKPGETENAKHMGARFVLEGQDGKEMASVLVGKDRPGREPPHYPQGQYLMKGQAKIIYLVDRYFELNEQKPADWMDKLLTRVPAKEVNRIVCFAGPGESPTLYEIARPEKDKSFQAVIFPQGLTLKTNEADRMAGFLSALSFDDVARADPKADPAAGPYVAFHTFGGAVYTVYPQEAPGEGPCKVLIRVTWENPGTPKSGAEAGAPSPEEAKKSALMEDRRLAPFEYTIGSWRCGTLAVSPLKLAETKPPQTKPSVMR